MSKPRCFKNDAITWKETGNPSIFDTKLARMFIVDWAMDTRGAGSGCCCEGIDSCGGGETLSLSVNDGVAGE